MQVRERNLLTDIQAALERHPHVMRIAVDRAVSRLLHASPLEDMYVYPIDVMAGPLLPWLPRKSCIPVKPQF